MIFYEHPFNERVRTFLRLEHLYARLEALALGESVTDHHFALVTLFEILEIAGRAELKTEVLKDLDKQKNILLSYRGNPAIDEAALSQTIDELDAAFHQLGQLVGRVGGQLGENDWLMSLRSRVSIPGGSCSFDLPAYHAWQQQPCDARQRDLQPWIQMLQPMREGVILLMRLIRASGTPLKMIAPGGQFQQYLQQGKPYHLMRVQFDKTQGVVPEISVNRLLIAIRFVKFSVMERPAQTSDDIAFELTLYH